MLMNFVALLAALVPIVRAAEILPPEVRHLEFNGLHLLDTTERNYALTALSFIEKGWQTVSVNNNQATFIAPNCQATIKNVEALNDDEKSMIEETYSRAESVDTDNQSQAADGRTRASSSRYAIDGSRWWFTSRSVSVLKFTIADYSFCKNDDNNFSAAKPGMPDNLSRIFVLNDAVTFVYHDLRVVMKPISCLDEVERQLFNNLEELIKEQLKEHPEEEEDEITKPEKIEGTAST